MVKYNKTVVELMERAMRNGKVKSGSYEAHYYPQEDIMVLSHYGTKIFQSEKGRLVRLGGYSQSDASSISTAMRVMGMRGEVSMAKKYQNKGLPTMNGWYIIR